MIGQNLTLIDIDKWILDLKEGGIESPLLELRSVISNISGIPSHKLLAKVDLIQVVSQLNEAQILKLHQVIKRRMQKEPLAKIIQKKEFFSLDFFTNEYTLDPRPESEWIIEAVLRHYCPSKEKEKRKRQSFFLDLGTGTGCLLITLLKNYPHSLGVGIDISHEALQVAYGNGVLHQVNDRCVFIQGNWTYSLNSHFLFDVIVCNPPYIKDGEQLDTQTLYDPPKALFGGIDGLTAYRSLLKSVKSFLSKDGFFILEVGYNQTNSVISLANFQGWTLKHVIRDLQGIDRVLILQKAE